MVWINRKYIYHIIIIRLYTFNCNINEALKSCNELEWRHILKNNALKPDLVCNNFVLFKRVPFWLTLLYNMNNYYNDKNYKFVTVYLPNFPMTLNYNGGHNIKHFLAPPTHVFIVQWQTMCFYILFSSYLRWLSLSLVIILYWFFVF